MSRNLKWKILSIILLILFFAWKAWPPKEKIDLGLDLQGGMHLVLKVETEKIPEEARSGAVDRALEIIRNRIDQFGVREPSIQKQGLDRIVVQLPGISERERERAISLIGKTALLEFKLVEADRSYNSAKLQQAIEGNVPEGCVVKFLDPEYFEEEKSLLLRKDVALAGENLVDAYVGRDEYGNPDVEFKLNRKGARIFARLTRENIHRRLAILLDGKVRSAPVIKTEIPAGNGTITGRFTYDEARDLAIALRAGALPCPLTIEEERTIGPSLGQDSIQKGIRAIIYGGIAVLCFMGVYYLVAGLIANFALCLNLLFILGTLSVLPQLIPNFKATLTLPGIAGILLTIGIAVDANVLIFERIREEFKVGKTIRFAISNGYKKAFLTILDANLTTLITALILFRFGTGPIRGFAVTLSIGILASMFTALVVTRCCFDLLCTRQSFTKIDMLRLVGDTKIDFIGKRKVAYLLSAVVIVVGLIAFALRGEKNFGIDFTGGTLQQFRFQRPVAADSLRGALGEIGLGESLIQHFGGGNEIIIRTDVDTHQEISQKFEEAFRDNKFELVRREKVGPAVGRDLRRKAFLALLYAMIGICLYITFRFKFKFAISAIVALFHDVLVTIGFFGLMGRELSLPVIAALLTIVGYSLNDTIVVFDRIREETKLMRKADFGTVVNTSINRTLSRTLLTSLTTLLVVMSLYIFGGEIINDFAFALLIGVVVGTYSSIFVASPILVDWHEKRG